MAIRQRAEDEGTGLLSRAITQCARRGLRQEVSLTLPPHFPQPETEDQAMTEELENADAVPEEEMNLKSYASPHPAFHLCSTHRPFVPSSQNATDERLLRDSARPFPFPCFPRSLGGATQCSGCYRTKMERGGKIGQQACPSGEMLTSTMGHRYGNIEGPVSTGHPEIWRICWRVPGVLRNGLSSVNR